MIRDQRSIFYFKIGCSLYNNNMYIPHWCFLLLPLYIYGYNIYSGVGNKHLQTTYCPLVAWGTNGNKLGRKSCAVAYQRCLPRAWLTCALVAVDCEEYRRLTCRECDLLQPDGLAAAQRPTQRVAVNVRDLATKTRPNTQNTLYVTWSRRTPWLIQTCILPTKLCKLRQSMLKKGPCRGNHATYLVETVSNFHLDCWDIDVTFGFSNYRDLAAIYDRRVDM